MTNRRGHLLEEQTNALLKPIKPGRVRERDGHSYLASWDVRAHLTRMFGFGRWEKEILELVQITEARGPDLGLNNKENWYVTYRCRLRLRVFDSYGHLLCENDDVAIGTAQNQPSLADAHDLASKNAVSYALKRCAIDLGDQFGLSLYNRGSTEPLVKRLAIEVNDLDEPAVDGDDDEERSFITSGDYG
jgi:recombination DNA repair RAD52 pathway protein